MAWRVGEGVEPGPGSRAAPSPAPSEEALGHPILEHDPVAELHHVEGGAVDRGVLAQRERTRDRHPRCPPGPRAPGTPGPCRGRWRSRAPAAAGAGPRPGGRRPRRPRGRSGSSDRRLISSKRKGPFAPGSRSRRKAVTASSWMPGTSATGRPYHSARSRPRPGGAGGRASGVAWRGARHGPSITNVRAAAPAVAARCTSISAIPPGPLPAGSTTPTDLVDRPGPPG